ncbi:MAG: dihydroorotase, partial [Candidatus Dormibacteria bacterium]
EIEAIAKAGAIAIKIFNTRHVKEVYPYISDLGVVDHGLMYEIYEAVAPTGLPVAVHHDDTEWVRRLVTRDYLDKGRTSNKCYMEAYEKGYMYGHGMVAGLAASLYYARLTQVKLYVLHVGMMPVGAFDLIRIAKEQFHQEVYAELEGSSMLMTRERAEKLGPRAMIWAHSPEASWKSLRDGVADVLVIEHAPHLREEVEPGWEDNFAIPLGQTGVQEFVPLMLTQVNEGRLTLAELVRFASENPAKIFGVYPRKGCIAIGSDADFTIVDMNARHVLRDADMRSKTGFTVWDGFEVTGMPRYTIVRGTVVMEKGKIRVQPGFGRFTKGVAAR